MVKKISIKTKFGWISAFEKKGRIYRIRFGKLHKQNNSKNLVLFKKNLFKYFNKKSKTIKAAYDIRGNKTQRKVWKELRRIECGQTKTYGEIAKKFKLSPRHIGKICSQNKIVLAIPCHRVIRSDSSLGGFSSSGGTTLKKKILDFEKNFLQKFS